MKKWFLAFFLIFSIFVITRIFGFPIEIIVPDGFSGKIEIIQDAEQGVKVPLVGFCYRVVIPKNGVLKVKSLAPWNPYHRENAMYSSGKTIRMMITTESSPKIPVLYGGGGGMIKTYNGKEVDINYIQYFLGNEFNNAPDMKKLMSESERK